MEPTSNAAVSAGEPGTAFLYTGLGSQYEGMGEALFAAEPVFRDTLERCHDALAPDLSPGILDVLYGAHEDRGRVHDILYSCPTTLALQCALARLWGSWGVEPGQVLGHSVGEYAAAVTAGVFRMEDGLRMLSKLGQLLEALPFDGRMLAVKATESRVAETLGEGHPGVSVAAVNAPGTVVLVGGATAVDRIGTEFEKAGIRIVPLEVSQATHSPSIAPILAEYRETVRSVRFHPPRIPYISALTGTAMHKEICEPEYWLRHVSEPIQFVTAMRTLLARQPPGFVEIGPGSTLLRMGQQCAVNGKIGAAPWVPSITPEADDCETIAASRATLSGPALGPPPAPSTPLDRLVRHRVAELAGLQAESIHPARPLAGFGMDSLTALDFISTVEHDTDVRLPVHLLNDRLTIDDVTAYVGVRLAPDRRVQLLGEVAARRATDSDPARRPVDPASATLVSLREPGTGPPLYFVPAGDGDLFAFRDIVPRLASEHPVYGLRPPSARALGRIRDVSMESLISRYVDEIRNAQPAGPYHVLGYSVGGIYAVEVARRLAQDGDVVDFLAILDSPIHIPGWVASLCAVLYGACNMLRLKSFARRADIRWLRRRLYGIADEGLRTHATVARKHEVLPYSGHIVHFRSRRSWIRALDSLAVGKSWTRVARGGREVHWIEGTHYELFRGEQPDVFADRLNECLRRHVYEAPPC